MEWLKINEEGEIELTSKEIGLVPELKALYNLNYNKQPKDQDGRKRFRAKAELVYLFLAYSPKSPYSDYSTLDRIEQAKLDAGLTGDWEESTELKLLINKFEKGSQNKAARALKTVENFLEKFENHLNRIDLDERNNSGSIVHDPAKILSTLKQLPDYLQTLQELERQVRHDIISTPKSRGDHELGWMALSE